jgi:phytoene/squalene synthetase
MTFPWQSGIDFRHDQDFEKILTNPFLDIAARFWEKPRYEAFQVCYRGMRRIDDLVDDRKAGGSSLAPGEIVQYRGLIDEWLNKLVRGDTDHPFLAELQTVMSRFAMPYWPWERLGQAMIYDLDHNGFASFHRFLRYTEGAAIAPASVFMHLCGVQSDRNGAVVPPTFDVRKAARPLAIFSYLVHIVRDFQKDQQQGLNYFADDFLSSRNLTVEELRNAAHGGKVSSALRDLMRLYRRLADYYRSRARITLDAHRHEFGPQYRLSLEVIYGLYHLVFERIDPENGRFTAAELNPTPAAIQSRLQQIVAEHHS